MKNLLKEIEINLDDSSTANEWSTDHGAYSSFFRKECGHRRSIYDIGFCTKVCELNLGDNCEPEFDIGDDLCKRGLFCDSQNRTCLSQLTSADLDYIESLFDE